MGIKDAIVLRIKELCKQKGIKFNTLATDSGVTPSTVYSLLDEQRRDIGVVVLKKLCDGWIFQFRIFLIPIYSAAWNRK